jgi:hypothetical protein
VKKLLFALLIAIAGAVSAPASAQVQPQALIVSACGTLPASYVAGTYGILTMDTNGKLCDSATGGGGGGGTSATYGAAFPTTGTPAGGTDGTNFQPLVVDTTTHYLQVDVKAGTFWPYTLGQQLAASSVPVVLTAAQIATLTPLSTVAVTATALTAATHAQCAALCSNVVAKGSAGSLFSFEVAADSTLSGAAWWIMVFDAASLPADGSVTPAKCYALPSGATGYNGAFSTGGLAFATGITIGVSTTGCFTKTASVHAFIAGDYQ